ncbi:MAG: hypothetical protein C4576_19750 [Desulfobacteraceae bacterium]|nr:MAG: hypothetical protein C4576_19750 [Desulfobacteraceae bacterium]
MPYKTVKYTREVEAVDIGTMESMLGSDYRAYLESSLLWIDHHDVLRSGPAGYPIAVTRAQARSLIEYLNEIKDRLKE